MPKEVRNQLTYQKVTKIKEAGRYADGNGLYLVVSEYGARYWQWRGTVLGRRREIGIGSAFLISLADARTTAAEWRVIARSGGDPAQVRDKDKRQAMTFENAARKVHREHIEPTAKNPKHAKQWLGVLEAYAFPHIGSRDVRTISQADVLAVLSPIWLSKAETARRCRQRMSVVFDWARTADFAEGVNPVEGVERGLPKQDGKAKHYAALPYAELPALMKSIEGVSGMGALALRFAILTAARGGEVRGARWNEIDFEARVWTVPAIRMKAKKDHRVPLTQAALDLLALVPKTDDLIFASTKPGRPVSDMTLAAVLKRLGIDVTVHGFRSTFRDWAEEKTSFPHEVKETALAHTIRNAVEAAYRRTDLFEKRIDLMAQWAAFVTGKPEVERKTSHAVTA